MAEVQTNAHRLYLAVYDKLSSQPVSEDTKHLIQLLHKTANPQFIHAKYQKQCHNECHDEVTRIRNLISQPTLQKLDAVLRILNPLAAKLLKVVEMDSSQSNTLQPIITTLQDAIQITLDLQDDVRCGIQSAPRVKLLAKKVDNIEDMGYGSSNIGVPADSMASMQNLSDPRSDRADRSERRGRPNEAEEYLHPCHEVEMERIGLGLSRESSLGNIDEIGTFEKTKSVDALPVAVSRVAVDNTKPPQVAEESQHRSAKNGLSSQVDDVEPEEAKESKLVPAQAPVTYSDVAHRAPLEAPSPTEIDPVLVAPYQRKYADLSEDAAIEKPDNDEDEADANFIVAPGHTRLARSSISQFKKPNPFEVLRQESIASAVYVPEEVESKDAEAASSAMESGGKQLAEDLTEDQVRSFVDEQVNAPAASRQSAEKFDVEFAPGNENEEKVLIDGIKPSVEEEAALVNETKESTNTEANENTITYSDVAQRAAADSPVEEAPSASSITASPYVRNYARLTEDNDSSIAEDTQSVPCDETDIDQVVAPGQMRMARTSISHFKKPNRFDVLRQDSIMSVPEEASSPVEAQPLLQHEEAGQVSQSAEVELATTKRDPLGQQLELRPSIQEESLYTEEAVSSRDVTEDLVTTNVAEQKEAESDDRMALARASQDDRPDTPKYSDVAQRTLPQQSEFTEPSDQDITKISSSYERKYAHPASEDIAASSAQADEVSQAYQEESNSVVAPGQARMNRSSISHFKKPNQFDVLRQDSVASTVSISTEEAQTQDQASLVEQEEIGSELAEETFNDEVLIAIALGAEDMINKNDSVIENAEARNEEPSNFETDDDNKDALDELTELQTETYSVDQQEPISSTFSSEPTYSDVAQRGPLHTQEMNAEEASELTTSSSPYVRKYARPAAMEESLDVSSPSDEAEETDLTVAPGQSRMARTSISHFKIPNRFDVLRQDSIASAGAISEEVTLALDPMTEQEVHAESEQVTEGKEEIPAEEVQTSVPIAKEEVFSTDADKEDSEADVEAKAEAEAEAGDLEESERAAEAEVVYDADTTAPAEIVVGDENTASNSLTYSEVAQRGPGIKIDSEENDRDVAPQLPYVRNYGSSPTNESMIAEASSNEQYDSDEGLMVAPGANRLARTSISHFKKPNPFDVLRQDSVASTAAISEETRDQESVLTDDQNESETPLELVSPGERDGGPVFGDTGMQERLNGDVATSVPNIQEQKEAEPTVMEDQPLEREVREGIQTLANEPDFAKESSHSPDLEVRRNGDKTQENVVEEERPLTENRNNMSEEVDEHVTVPVKEILDVIAAEEGEEQEESFPPISEQSLSVPVARNRLDAVTYSDVAQRTPAKASPTHVEESPMNTPSTYIRTYARPAVEDNEESRVPQLESGSDIEDDAELASLPGQARVSRFSISQYKKPNRFDVLRQDSAASSPEMPETREDAEPVLTSMEIGRKADPESPQNDSQHIVSPTEEDSCAIPGDLGAQEHSHDVLATSVPETQEQEEVEPSITEDRPSELESLEHIQAPHNVQEGAEQSSRPADQEHRTSEVCTHEIVTEEERPLTENRDNVTEEDEHVTVPVEEFLDAIASEEEEKSLPPIGGQSLSTPVAPKQDAVTYSDVAQRAPAKDFAVDVETSPENSPSAYIRTYARPAVEDNEESRVPQLEFGSDIEDDAELASMPGQARVSRFSISQYKKPNRFDVLRQDSAASSPEMPETREDAEPVLASTEIDREVDADSEQPPIEQGKEEAAVEPYAFTDAGEQNTPQDEHSEYTRLADPADPNVQPASTHETVDREASDVSMSLGEFMSCELPKPSESESNLSKVNMNRSQDLAVDQSKHQHRLPVGHLRDIVSENSASTLTPLLDSAPELAEESETEPADAPPIAKNPLTKIANWFGMGRKSPSPSPLTVAAKDQDDAADEEVSPLQEQTQMTSSTPQDDIPVNPFRSAGRDSFAEFQSGVASANPTDEITDAQPDVESTRELESTSKYAVAEDPSQRQNEVVAKTEPIESEIQISDKSSEPNEDDTQRTTARQEDMNSEAENTKDTKRRTYRDAAKVDVDEIPPLTYVISRPASPSKLEPRSMPRALSDDYDDEGLEEEEDDNANEDLEDNESVPGVYSPRQIALQSRRASAHVKIDNAFKRTDSEVPLRKQAFDRSNATLVPESWEDNIFNDSAKLMTSADFGPRCSFRSEDANPTHSEMADTSVHSDLADSTPAHTPRSIGGTVLPDDVNKQDIDPKVLAILGDYNIPQYVKDLMLQKELEILRLKTENERLSRPAEKQALSVDIPVTSSLDKQEVCDSAIAIDDAAATKNETPPAEELRTESCPLCRSSVTSDSLTCDLLPKLRSIWTELMSFYMDELPNVERVTDIKFMCDQISSSIGLLDAHGDVENKRRNSVLENGRSLLNQMKMHD